MTTSFLVPALPTTSPRPQKSSTAWNLPCLSGRLVELSGHGPGATLTLAFNMVLDAQVRGEPVAWIQARRDGFYPPDVAEGGVDLDTLAVIRAATRHASFRAADHLLRSGAFGLVILDLGAVSTAPMAVQSRLAGLARKHETAVLALTRKSARDSSLGSLVSLRGHGYRKRRDTDRFECTVHIIKDKRSRPGWSHGEVCRGPAGLC